MSDLLIGFLAGSSIGFIGCLVLANIFYNEYCRLVKVHNDTVALLTEGRQCE